MDHLFHRIELPITIDQFHRLPQNPAYKYEYFDGRAVLTPRPKGYHAVLDLKPIEAGPEWDIKPLQPADFVGMEGAFLSAQARTQPFASLDETAAHAAAHACLERTRSGKDGPLIERACFQVIGQHFTDAVGAALVTLQPDSIRTDPFAGGWKDNPPEDAVAQRLGCPHLTWIFVSLWEARRGAGTALLSAVVRALMEMGYQHLASTFLLGNDASVLWHWKNGFRLIPWSDAFKRPKR